MNLENLKNNDKYYRRWCYIANTLKERLNKLLDSTILDEKLIERCKTNFGIEAPTQMDGVLCGLIGDGQRGVSNSTKLILSIIDELPELKFKEKELNQKKELSERGY